MDNLFLILFFVSFLALIVGLFKPNIVLGLLPVAKKNQKKTC